MQGKDSKLVRTRWVMCSKGDEQKPDVRARLVACEINNYKTDDVFASTPPLDANRMLISQMATQRRHPNGELLERSFVDVKKAYFNGIPRRRLHLFMPKGMGLGKQAVGLLKKCVYGTRDAGMV